MCLIQITYSKEFMIFQALNPFYVFQLYTSIIWVVQDYLMYTAAVVLLATISIGVTVYETRKVIHHITKKTIILLYSNIFILNMQIT